MSSELSVNETTSNDGTFFLNWTPSTHADNYSIYEDSTLLVPGLTNSSYLVSGLTDNSYSYTVVAVNIYGTATSNSVVVIVQRIPLGLTLTINPLTSTDGTIAFSWTQSSYATTYAIYANSNHLVASGLTSLSFILDGVTDGTFNYTIVASNAYGSDTSNTVTVIVQNYPHSFALSPVPSPNHSGNITLSWTSSVYDASYTVYQNSSVIATGLTNLSLSLSGLADGNYNFTIVAVNAYGNATSNTVTVIVQNTTFPQQYRYGSGLRVRVGLRG